MTTTIYMIVKYRMRGKRYHLNHQKAQQNVLTPSKEN